MKKVSLLLVLAFMAITMSAQESAEAGRKATFKRNGFWDNWFIGAGATANIYVGNWDQHASFFGSRPSLAGYLQVGKWFNPYIGGRLKGSYGSLHTFIGENAEFMQHQKLGNVQADVMFDVTNYLGRYNENRFYNFITYAGIGAAWGLDAKILDQEVGPDKRTVTVGGGIINKFRLGKRVSLDLEFGGHIYKDNFDHDATGNWNLDGLFTTSLGLTVKVGKLGFEEAVLRDQAEIDALNNQINSLRQENEILRKRPTDCPKCPEAQVIEQVTQDVFVSNVVFFRLNSAKIDAHQRVNIYNTAQYLKENANAKVKIVGYADKKTGTPSYNEKLSEKRAKTVADELINKYGIESSRVSVDWKGDTVQPYAENAWNRVAIFYAD